MFTSSVNGGSINGASSRASERSVEARDDAAGGRSLTPGRRSSYAVDKPDRRRSRGTSANSRLSAGRPVRSGSSHARGRDASMSTEPSSDVAPVHVGIDVSKARLDVCLLPAGQTLSVDNTDDGVAQLVAQLVATPKQHPVALCLLETTGRSERRGTSAL